MVKTTFLRKEVILYLINHSSYKKPIKAKTLFSVCIDRGFVDPELSFENFTRQLRIAIRESWKNEAENCRRKKPFHIILADERGYYHVEKSDGRGAIETGLKSYLGQAYDMLRNVKNIEDMEEAMFGVQDNLFGV